MKNDLELLEMAAKADGREIKWMTQICPGRADETFSANWNPLIDDGDALRLAVKLHMLIEINLGCVIAYAERKDGSIQEPEYVYFDKLETGREQGDRGTATRRAIVRAAAEIGKAMP